MGLLVWASCRASSAMWMMTTRMFASCSRSVGLPPEGLDLREHLAELEQSLIQQALDDANFVVARAAERLRIRRTTLVEKMRKYGMSRDAETTVSREASED